MERRKTLSNIKFKGLDKIQKQLKEMEKGLNDLGQNGEISFNDLFTPSFMAKFTNKESIADFLGQCGYPASTTEEFRAIPDAEFDIYVNMNTRFSSWKEMLKKATNDYVSQKIGQ